MERSCLICVFFMSCLVTISLCQDCDGNLFQCGTRCIPPTWVCDNEQDCPDGSDELDCSNVSCRPDQFHCHNGACVEDRWVCDGYGDCADGSDETNCDSLRPSADPSGPCLQESHFQCGNGLCIPKSWECDQEPDCTDGTDEENCGSTLDNLVKK